MLKIRLQRIGKKNQAYFRLVILEHTTKPKGRYLELLGSYDPHKKIVRVKKDRIEYWLSKGAKLSPTANNLLVGREIIKGEKVLAWKPKKKPQKEAPAPQGTILHPAPPVLAGEKQKEPTVKQENQAEEKLTEAAETATGEKDKEIGKIKETPAPEAPVEQPTTGEQPETTTS